jgi:hypothetical protein
MGICRRNGLLGQLAVLDFRTLANQEPGISDLTKLDACFGTVHAEKRHLGVWREHLMLPLIR